MYVCFIYVSAPQILTEILLAALINPNNPKDLPKNYSYFLSVEFKTVAEFILVTNLCQME